MNTVAETLRKARALIDTPERWTQGIYRRYDHVNGELVVKSRCSGGAIIDADPAASTQAIEFLEKHIFVEYASLAKWNDQEERTHKQVLDMFDEVIALAE